MRPARKIALLVLPVVVLAVAAVAVLKSPRREQPSPTPPPGPRVLATLPEFVLEDEHGESVNLYDLRGTVWIADFIFTRCAGTCPMITQQMSKLAREFRSKPALAQVKFVSFSVDPEHDRPGVLGPYGRKNGSDPARWMFLTGTQDAIRTLVTKGFLLPVEDQADPAMPIVHSQNFVIVDREGRLRGAFDALSVDGREDLREVLEKVVGEHPGATHYAGFESKKPEWIGDRQAAQVAAAASLAAPHDFRFADRTGASGITFIHTPTVNTGRRYSPNHYDHGTALAVADVDGDGLTDLYFVNQLGRNGLFRNLGAGRFRDITAGSPVAVGDRACVGASFADIDNDGDPDLVVTSVREGNLLFLNDGRGGFTDITAKSGLDDNRGHGAGAVFFDYDRDGLLDLFVANTGQYTSLERGPDGLYVAHKDAFSGHLIPERWENSNLYRNLGGGVFANVSESSGLVSRAWSADAATIDYDGDGNLDLYVLSMQGHDELWHNKGDGRFECTGRTIFPATPWGAMGVTTLDWDGDGRLDIFVADMHTDMSGLLDYKDDKLKHDPATMFPPKILLTDGNHILGNALFSNRGSGKFEENSDAANVETGWPWGSSAADLNADGWPDLFVTAGMGYPFRYGGNSLLLNDGGKRFADAEFVVGIEPRDRLYRPWLELECDGIDQDNVHAKGRKGHLSVWGARSSRSSALFDLDGDGDLDIVTNEYGDVPQVLVSDFAQTHPAHFVSVRLVGKRSNRDGIGATVTVVAAGRSQVQVHNGGTGYLAHGVLPLYFGLREAGSADSVTVKWPTGRTQVVTGPLKSGVPVIVTEEP